MSWQTEHTERTLKGVGYTIEKRVQEYLEEFPGTTVQDYCDKYSINRKSLYNIIEGKSWSNQTLIKVALSFGLTVTVSSWPLYYGNPNNEPTPPLGFTRHGR